MIQFTLPPLRERLDDVPLLVKYFCQQIAEREGRHIAYPDREAMRLLENMLWPGNVRELENVIERAVIYAKERPIGVVDLPESLTDNVVDSLVLGCNLKGDLMPAFAGVTIKAMEKQMILAALERCPSKAQAARELGISVRKIEYRLKEWHQG